MTHLPIPPRRGATSIACLLALCWATHIQAKSLEFSSLVGLSLHHTKAQVVSFHGSSALQLTSGSPPTADRQRVDHLAIVDGLGFTNGTIEVDLAGAPNPNATGGARGFVGVAFRVQEDRQTYDCFYLRPTNGRADDQERRNHTAQYISHPDYPWHKLRKETPSRYESYVDIMPATWIHVRIEVDGERARLFVDDRDQPTLVVNDLKSGANGRGSVAIWFEGSTIAHAKNLTITPR